MDNNKPRRRDLGVQAGLANLGGTEPRVPRGARPPPPRRRAAHFRWQKGKAPRRAGNYILPENLGLLLSLQRDGKNATGAGARWGSDTIFNIRGNGSRRCPEP